MHETKPDLGAKKDSGEPEQPSPVSPASSFRGWTHSILVGRDGLRPGWRIFLYLGMAVVLFLILSSFEHLIPARGPGRLWRTMFIEGVLALSCLLPACVMAAIEKLPFASYGFSKPRMRTLFGIGVVWGAAALSALMFLLWLVGVFSYGGVTMDRLHIFKFALFWGAFFLIVGVFEEFTFRGYLQYTMARWIGFWPAACVLSFLFGAIHLWGNVGESALGALCAALIGLFFCLSLRRTGSLWFALGMHACWDWGESYLYSVPDSGGTITGHLLNSSFHGSRWLTGGTVGPEGSVLVFVVIAASWVIFDRIYPGRKPARPHADVCPGGDLAERMG
jgi:uncharacterized protein